MEGIKYYCAQTISPLAFLKHMLERREESLHTLSQGVWALMECNLLRMRTIFQYVEGYQILKDPMIRKGEKTKKQTIKQRTY